MDHKWNNQGEEEGLWQPCTQLPLRLRAPGLGRLEDTNACTKDEEDLHSQVTDAGRATGGAGLPGCAHTHTIGHSDSHIECGEQDEAIPGGS